MKKISIIVVFVLSLLTLPHFVIAQSIEETLISQIENRTDKEVILPYILLEKMVLSETSFDKLEAMYKNEKDSLHLFLQSALLASQTQYRPYQKDFIQLYPTGEKLNNFNKMVYEANFKKATSPFQNQLAQYALSDGAALEKLVQSVEVVDGANAETLQEQLYKVECEFPQKVQKIFEKYGINKEDYFVGQAFAKSGKPTDKEVIYILMQNHHVALKGQRWCEGVGTYYNDQTIGEYLSGMWAYHTDTTYPNSLEISIEEGLNEQVDEKHWKVTFYIVQEDKQSPLQWGVSFFVLDRNQQVIPNSFHCIGAG